MILSTDASGRDFARSISKTWAKDSIEKGASTKNLSWGFGDARYTLGLQAARGNVVSSLTNPEHKFEMKPHTVNCQIYHGGDVTRIDVTLAPMVTFKDGKAAKAELDITEVESPTVMSTGAAWVEKNFNLFPRETVE